jgi:hypothetical protein
MSKLLKVLILNFSFVISIQAYAEEKFVPSKIDRLQFFVDTKINSIDVTDPKSVGHAFIRLIQTKEYELAVQHVEEEDRSGFLYFFYNELKKLPPVPKEPQVVVMKAENKHAEISIPNWGKKIGFDLVWQQNRWWIRK